MIRWSFLHVNLVLEIVRPTQVGHLLEIAQGRSACFHYMTHFQHLFWPMYGRLPSINQFVAPYIYFCLVIICDGLKGTSLLATIQHRQVGIDFSSCHDAALNCSAWVVVDRIYDGLEVIYAMWTSAKQVLESII